jgi:IS1 family transposase
MPQFRAPSRLQSKKRRLILKCDELWSFVGNKRRQKWIWLAINRDTREIVGVAIGARTKATARKLWASLPAVYRQCAVCYSDFWEAYAAILPSKRHRAVGKESGQTNHIKRRVIRCANAVVVWYAQRFHSRRSWPITLVPPGISYTTITHNNA